MATRLPALPGNKDCAYYRLTHSIVWAHTHLHCTMHSVLSETAEYGTVAHFFYASGIGNIRLIELRESSLVVRFSTETKLFSIGFDPEL